MREIKFRVWSGSMWLDGNDANIQPIDPDSTTIELEASSPHQKHIMCQYTGLKDKNGKEIYEGDIVRILYTDWPSNPAPNNEGLEEYKDSISGVGAVVYAGDRFSIEFSPEKATGDIFPGTHGQIKVIGNIYENKELLK